MAATPEGSLTALRRGTRVSACPEPIEFTDGSQPAVQTADVPTHAIRRA